MNKEILMEDINSHMKRYFNAKDNFNLLTEDNKMLIGKVEQYIANLPEGSEIKTLINEQIDEYSSETKSLGDTKSMNLAYDLKQGQALVRVKKENTEYSSRAAFINIAILLYGVLNIGFILATALLK